MRCKDEYIGSHKYVIARTKEQTKIICKHLHKMGYKWNSGDSYLELNYWKGAHSLMSYRLNGGASVEIDYYGKEYYKEFEEVFGKEDFITF